MLKIFAGKKATIRPIKQHKSFKRQELSKRVYETLGTSSMKEAVTLPEGEDINEWLAVNSNILSTSSHLAVDFFNEISLLYGMVSDFCTQETCPVMTAGSDYEYLWADGIKVKRPIRVSAADYTDLLMVWVESQLNDEQLFPLQLGTPFPRNFRQMVKLMYKRLFRIYGHIYHTHFENVQGLGAEAHLNTCFKHFIYFVKEFQLIDSKDLAPLNDLIASMMELDQHRHVPSEDTILE